MSGHGNGKLMCPQPAQEPAATSGDSCLDLRRQAEKRVRPLSSQALEILPPDEVRRLAHELQVHQVELEMQNEDLRHARDELEMSQSRYFQLYDLAPVGYVTVDERGMIQEANLRAAILLGMPRKDLIRQPLSFCIHPDDQDLYYFYRKKFFSDGETKICELRLIRGDGAHFWARLDSALEDREAGRPFCRVTMCDISELKAADKALRESEEKYRTIADFTYDWEYWLAPDRRFLYCSSACERITGYQACEFQRDPGLFMAIVHPEDRELLERHLSQSISPGTEQCGKPNALEFRIIARSGEVRWLGHVCCAVYGRDGDYLGRRGCNRDITEHKLAEAEKKKLQEDLHQSHKLESVGRLAGGVAHDFNNMLGVIIGYAEMTLDKLDPMNPEFGYVEQILNAARRSADLTRQLLAFARKQQINPRVLNLNEVVPNMLKLLRRLIGEDVELILTAGEGLWPVYMDPSQLDQILANLCVNARDAMPSGGKITIETENVVLDQNSIVCGDRCTPGDHVMLVVSDTGCGMEDELIENIFEPFFTTKGPSRGTGMGLATVYGIVRQNAGCIKVESAPGAGTIFRIYLPRAESMGGAAEKRTITAAPPRGHGELILLVEDNPTVLAMTRTMLEQIGYTVLPAGKPEEALRLVEEQPGKIALLLTDIIMPGMNGKELMERVRVCVPGMRCLLMSGYAGGIINDLAILGDDTPFIAKPFSQREIAEKIWEVLNQPAPAEA